jgi:hypothetical protein
MADLRFDQLSSPRNSSCYHLSDAVRVAHPAHVIDAGDGFAVEAHQQIARRGTGYFQEISKGDSRRLLAPFAEVLRYPTLTSTPMSLPVSSVRHGRPALSA